MAYSYTTEALYSGEHVRGMDMTPETIPCFIQRRNSYQKVIICLAVTSALSLSMATQFLRCRGGTLFWFQRCDFRTVKKPFSLTTAAQNIHVFRRKSPLHKITFSGS